VIATADDQGIMAGNIQDILNGSNGIKTRMACKQVRVVLSILLGTVALTSGKAVSLPSAKCRVFVTIKLPCSM
jgi:hypothetical protein